MLRFTQHDTFNQMMHDKMTDDRFPLPDHRQHLHRIHHAPIGSPGAPLWGDMTALPEVDGRYVIVSRQRGQQPNEVDQLDSWLHDGSAAYLESLCEWE